VLSGCAVVLVAGAAALVVAPTEDVAGVSETAGLLCVTTTVGSTADVAGTCTADVVGTCTTDDVAGTCTEEMVGTATAEVVGVGMG